MIAFTLPITYIFLLNFVLKLQTDFRCEGLQDFILNSIADLFYHQIGRPLTQELKII